MIYIAPTGRGYYHAALNASIRFTRREMDQPQLADATLGSLQAKGSEAEPSGPIKHGAGAGDFGWRRNQLSNAGKNVKPAIMQVANPIDIT